MSFDIEFENHFTGRCLEVLFPAGVVIKDAGDVLRIKEKWMEALKYWHSPYTCLFHCRGVVFEPACWEEFEKMLLFFKNFFMRKIIFAELEALPPFTRLKEDVAFAVKDMAEAAKLAGLGRGEGRGMRPPAGDLRGNIRIENDFQARVMEIDFLTLVEFRTAADVEVLKSKLQNILMMWHSPYSVLINCSQCTFSTEAAAAFTKVERFLRGFFCKTIIGYSPRAAGTDYPFPTLRSRHVAAARVSEGELQAGNEANCASRKI